MVSEAKAREIAGNHVDKIVGGPEVRYRVVSSMPMGDGAEIEVEVWRGPDERNNADRYVVNVDGNGNITDASWW